MGRDPAFAVCAVSIKMLFCRHIWCVCRCVVPIGALFAVTLWLGNAAYLHLSVSFVQMLKVRMV